MQVGRVTVHMALLAAQGARQTRLQYLAARVARQMRLARLSRCMPHWERLELDMALLTHAVMLMARCAAPPAAL